MVCLIRAGEFGLCSNFFWIKPYNTEISLLAFSAYCFFHKWGGKRHYIVLCLSRKKNQTHKLNESTFSHIFNSSHTPSLKLCCRVRYIYKPIYKRILYNWSDQHSNSNLLCLVISLKKFLSPIFNQEIVLHKNQKIHYTTPLYITYKGYLIYLISDLLYLYTTVIVFLKKKSNLHNKTLPMLFKF